MCMCVEYMVANLILLCSLKTYLSFETWKYLQENMGYLIHLFFSHGHLSTHCFNYLGHLSIFSLIILYIYIYIFMNNSCLAHASFLHGNCWRDSNKNLEHLFDVNLWSKFLVFSPSVGVKHFWVDLNGKHIFAPTLSVGVVHIWVVCTWSWF